MKKILFAGLLFTGLVNTTGSFAQSVTEKLSGNWTVTEIILDLNGNNQPDKNEQMKANSLGFYINLNADGTGTARMDIFSTREDRIKWSTGNNNTEINFSGSGNADKRILCYQLADANNTVHIDKLSGNNLQLSSNEGEKMWISLKRK